MADLRKSKRAHTAVDYAGLNEGVVRTPEDSPEHHYITWIKDGTLTFAPDTFARVRPEILSRDFLEKSHFTEPMVVPAWTNPRPGYPTSAHLNEEDSEADGGDEPQETPPCYYEYVPDEGQDSLDMVIPPGLTVRRVAELHGPDEPVEVIEVKSQEGSDKRWTMRKWADYYEQEGEKQIRNVISLEVSQSKLGRLLRRPRVVRELDLQDAVWPREEVEKGLWPKVQYYCLMSVKDAYTDFHVDFGGSSVFYHIVKGKKTFFFIPPTKTNLKKYEEWCLSPAQNWTFLGSHVKDCYRVDLSEGDTMLIPSGWIHSVWTPENSLVIGGNFLTRLSYETQIKVAEIEKVTKVPKKFRYPYFQKVMWYTVLKYLDDDPLPQSVAQSFHQRKRFHRENPIYEEVESFGENAKLDAEQYNARYYSRAELDGLPALVKFIHRTVMISLGKIENITPEVRNAVSKSIPKGRGDPLEIIKTFAAWVAWKRGNEDLPEWAHADPVKTQIEDTKMEKKPSTPIASADTQTYHDVHSPSPRRLSESVQQYPLDLVSTAAAVNNIVTPTALAGKHLSTPKTSQLGPKRVACDACRRRRIRCKHKDDVVTPVALTGQPSMSEQLHYHAGQVNGSAAPTMANPRYDPALMLDSHHRLVIQDPHAEMMEGKKGRNKACVDCRRSKVGAVQQVSLNAGLTLHQATMYP
jgi:F-box and leucine-rich repeat protein 10/11